jgi:ribosomal protein L22
MTPDKPQDPQKGKASDTPPEDAADAKATVEETPAQPEPKVTETDAAPEAEGTAAAETGVDKLAAASADEVGRGDEQGESGADEVGRGDEQGESGADEVGRGDERSEAGESVADADEPLAAPGDDHPAAETPDEEPPAEAVAEEPKKKPAAEEPKRRRGRGRKTEEPKAVPVGLKVSAQAKYVRTSARKARLVCDHIRGKDVSEARAILAFTPRGAAKPWSKLLESAVANAEHNHELVGEDLRIVDVHADEGPTLKRYRPRAMGRATRIRKRTSHLSITLTPKEL